MPRVRDADAGKEIDWPEDRTLLECSLENGIEISHVCGGDGACGTCRIEVVEGWENLSLPTPDEVYKEIEPPYRLSCQTKARGHVVIKIAKIE